MIDAVLGMLSGSAANSIIVDAPPDIPRVFTGIAEWAAALVYILLMRPRFVGWRRYAVIGAGLPFMIALQMFAGTLSLAFWVFGMVLAIAGMAALIHWTSNLGLRDTVYLTCRAFVLAELVASLEWQLWVHWVWRTDRFSPDSGPLQEIVGVVLLLLCYGVGFGAAYIAERRNFPRGRWLSVDGPSIVVSSAIALGTFFVSNLSFAWAETPFSGSSGFDIFYIRTLVDLAGFVALYTQQGHQRQVRNEIELAESRTLLSAQHEQFLQSKHNIEELNRMHHDLKHYVAAIRAEESAARRSEYLHQLEETLKGYESEIRTGNATLDVILISKFARSKREDIAMTVTVDGRAVDFMDLMRLSSLFGNALDNAIEASKNVKDPEQRIINVSTYREADFVLIRFENFMERPVRFVDGVPQTTKKDRQRHGYGLPNIRRIVESYGGSMTIDTRDSWFSLKILMPYQGRGLAD